MGVYGICYHTLDELYRSLKKHSPLVNQIKPDSVVIVTDKDLLKRNFTRLNKTLNSSTYFILGGKDYLKELNLTYADLGKNGQPIKTLGRKLSLCVESKGEELNITKQTPQKLLKTTKPSIIKDLGTVLYNIQNKKTRTLYRNAIFCTLKSGSFSRVSVILESKSKNAVKLKKIIESKNFQNVLEAVDSVKHGTSISQAARTKKVSKFDINYILAFKESE